MREEDRCAILITVLWWVSAILMVGHSPQLWTLECLDQIWCPLCTHTYGTYTPTVRHCHLQIKATHIFQSVQLIVVLQMDYWIHVGAHINTHMFVQLHTHKKSIYQDSMNHDIKSTSDVECFADADLIFLTIFNNPLIRTMIFITDYYITFWLQTIKCG